MAVELVTGFAGYGSDGAPNRHVSSSEDGARQAGTVGTGMYVMETVDDPLASTLENSNTVTVGPGDVLMNGRHVQLTGSTSFAIPVGTQGMQTSNLLVLRYTLGDTGVESVEALTLTGTPAESDPQDPAINSGSILDGDSPVDMPLYRVVTTGIETAEPVKLFETVPPYTELDIPEQLSELGGTLDASKIAGTLPVSHGGTGKTTAADARTALGVPPTSHASSATTYGAGNASNYGHVKLTDSTGATDAASSGVAASPKMVRDSISQSAGKAVLLWSGSVKNGGSMTVANIASYRLVAVEVLIVDRHVLAVGGVQSNAIFAGDSWSTDSSGVMRILGVYFARSGTKLTLKSSCVVDCRGVDNSNVTIGNNYAVTKVYGIAKA